MVIRGVHKADQQKGPLIDTQGGLKMNYTQNHKISQITPSTLIIGIDIAKDKHVARVHRMIEALSLVNA